MEPVPSGHISIALPNPPRVDTIRHLMVNPHTKTGFVRMALVPLCGVILCGCSTQNYGLTPAPASVQSTSMIGGVEYVNQTGSLANLSVAADVDGFLKSKYIIVVLVLSNTSSSTFDVGYDSFDVQCSNRGSERLLAPIEPDALISEFSKERRSEESARGWGTFFQALASAHHDPGANVDYDKVSQTVSSGTAANRMQTQEDSRKIRIFDRLLIRRAKVQPGAKGLGIVFFPFSEADNYKVRVRIGEETHEFLFHLRSY